MAVRVFREFPFEDLDDGQVAAAVEAALSHGGRPTLAVDVVLVSDRVLAELHARFLDDPSPTDVMAFDLGPPEHAGGDEGDGEPEAEIYVSVERARSVARERELPPARELALYLVHGALHLCGFDDRQVAERARMREAEALVLARLGLPATPGR